jgi:hypothetical protein
MGNVKAKACVGKLREGPMKLLGCSPVGLARVHVLQQEPVPQGPIERQLVHRVRVHDDPVRKTGKLGKQGNQLPLAHLAALRRPVDADVAEGQARRLSQIFSEGRKLRLGESRKLNREG